MTAAPGPFLWLPVEFAQQIRIRSGKYKRSGPWVGSYILEEAAAKFSSSQSEKFSTVARAVTPSEDPSDRQASPRVMGLETDLETSPGEKPACHQKAIPAAHLTFVIDCARGKQLSLVAPPVPPRAPGPHLGPVTPPMKTYILFCGGNRPHLTQEAPPGGVHLAHTGGTLPPRRGTVAPASSPVSPRVPQEAPEAKGNPLKIVPSRSSAWGTVIGSLKALSSCVCGQAE
ncbi:steroid receptor-associated and regulated protein [Ursus arctos]|uniref:steroid receptor-associated and regulated protein n=1 Tax=Ursus arctos TaxID=9644 RepID=UPI001CF88393|nr:steroid receptor-associated and regulated protein [Ursus arctos]